jgi:hypothetical protein
MYELPKEQANEPFTLEGIAKGTLSEAASVRIYGDKSHTGEKVAYTLPLMNGIARYVWNEETKAFIAKFVGIGPEGVIGNS